MDNLIFSLLCIEGKRWQVTVESRLKYLEQALGDSDAKHREEPLLIVGSGSTSKMWRNCMPNGNQLHTEWI